MALASKIYRLLFFVVGCWQRSSCAGAGAGSLVAPPARLVAPAPARCAAARQKQARVRQPAAQPPQAWKEPPTYELHEDARSSTASSSISSLGTSCQTRSSRSRRRRSASCRPSRWTATRARCRVAAGTGTGARCARSTSVARTTVGRLTPGSGLMAIPTTARCTPSRSSVAATPSSCARWSCRLPAAPPLAY